MPGASSRSGQSAAIENALREQICAALARPAPISSGERAPRMLLAFLLEGQGKRVSPMSEWQSMVTRPAPERLRRFRRRSRRFPRRPGFDRLREARGPCVEWFHDDTSAESSRNVPDRPLEPAELERFRAYLDLLARLEVAPRLRDKVDLSGVVQQTLLEAHQGIARASAIRTDAPRRSPAWLRSILSHNLADVLRKLTARKRDFRREWSLESALDQSASRVEQWLAAEQSSPSRQAIRQEELLRMAESLATLPEGQRRAIELHHLQGRPLAEIARELGTTKSAVAGLLHRGLKAPADAVWNH